MNTNLIIAIIAGVVVLFLLLVIIAVIVFVMMRKRKAKQQQLSRANEAMPAIAESQPMPSTQYEVSPATTAWTEPVQSSPQWSEPVPSTPQWTEPSQSSAPPWTPEPAPPVWTPEPQSPSTQSSMVQPPTYPGQYVVEEEAYTPAPPPISEPEPVSPFAAPPPPPIPVQPSIPEPPSSPTGPFPPGMTTMPPPPPTYPTSPNVRMNTSQHSMSDIPSSTPVHTEAPKPQMPSPIPVHTEVPQPPPPSSVPPVDMPIDERGVTMDLSQYKKMIEEQLKPKSPGSIVFTSGTLEGKTFEIPPEGFFVGRDSHSSQVVIPDPRVSKTHVWIGLKDGRVLIVDQESRNGTFINDTNTARASQREIKDGDIIILGEANVARFEFKAAK